MEVDLISLLRSKLTWFLCGGSKLVLFSMENEIDLALVRRVEVDLVFVCGPKMTCFWDRMT